LISTSTIASVRERADILAVIGEAVPTLKRMGRSYTGLCPFHKEKTPSFHVNPDRGFFHCFGCKESGSAIDFVMKLEGATFPEAVRQLAERFNIEVEEDDKGHGDAGDAARARRAKEELFAANEFAALFYETCLREHTLRDYPHAEIARRGLVMGEPKVDEVLAQFRVGYAPHGWDELAVHLRKKGISPQVAESVGLLVPRSSGTGHYDRFRHRLMFGVVDVQGRVVAFSGRALEAPPGDPPSDQKPAKYINSPESAVYSKGHMLFGIHAARHGIREAGAAVLVEGNFDVVSLHARGLSNVVAPLGTAFTQDQAKLLKRFAPEVVFLFDGDAAGKKAVRLSRAPVKEAGLRARVATLPDGLDPDEYAKTHGAEKLAAVIGNARGLLEHSIDEALSVGFSSANLEDKVARVTEVERLLREEDDPLVRSLAKAYADELAGRLDLVKGGAFQALEQSVKKALMGSLANRPNGPTPARARVKSRPAGSEERRAITETLVAWPELLFDEECEAAVTLLEGPGVHIVAALRKHTDEVTKKLDVDAFVGAFGSVPSSRGTADGTPLDGASEKLATFAKEALVTSRFFEVEQAKVYLLENANKLKRLLLAAEAIELARENYGTTSDWEQEAERAREALDRVRQKHGLRHGDPKSSGVGEGQGQGEGQDGRTEAPLDNPG
jgi:DNA primase